MPFPKRDAAAIAAARSRAAKWKRIRFRDNRTVTPSDTIGSNLCWCGEKSGHTWPGQDEGVKHPLPEPDRPLPPKVLLREAQQALQEAGVCPACRGYPEVRAMRRLVNGSIKVVEEPWCDMCLGVGVFPPPSVAAAERWRKEQGFE